MEWNAWHEQRCRRYFAGALLMKVSALAERMTWILTCPVCGSEPTEPCTRTRAGVAEYKDTYCKGRLYAGLGYATALDDQAALTKLMNA